MNRPWVPKGGNVFQIARRCQSEKKVVYTIMFDSKGIVLQKSRKAGKSITVEYYRDCVLSGLNKCYKKAESTSGMCGMTFLHGNTPGHKSKPVQEYLSKEGIQTLPHPSYSPDLALCFFFFFFFSFCFHV